MLQVSVVVATHNRAALLGRLLDALRAQSLSHEAFEVVVVDDASTDGTRGVLEEAVARGDLDVRVIHRSRSEGPGAARNEGWLAARAPLVAFTDDDCAPTPGWLAAGLAACAAAPGAVVQGKVAPDPAQAHLLGPFSRSLRVERLDGWFPTANVFYPRALLEELGGFDAGTFTGPGGEDTDLAWRAIRAGAPTAFCEDALVHHVVHLGGPVERLRNAIRWSETMAVFARYPELRKSNLVRGIFWKPQHYHLTRTLLALALPRPLRWIAVYFAYRYGVLLWQRAHQQGDGSGGGPAYMPYFALYDLLETATAARGAVRYRTLVL